MIYRIHQFLAFSLDRRRLPTCLPPFTLRASCVLVRFRCRFDRLVHPCLSSSSSSSLSFSFSLLPPPPLRPSNRTNLLFFSTRPRSVLFFRSFRARGWLNTNDRKKESRWANVVGRTVERLYRRFVHADYRFHATRGRLLLPPLTPTCKPAMCTSLWKVSSFLSSRRRDSTPPRLCVDACLLCACSGRMCVCARSCGQQPS